MKTKLVSIKNAAKAHSTQILGTALVASATVVYLQNKGIESLNDFLKENDLFDKYYSTDED